VLLLLLFKVLWWSEAKMMGEAATSNSMNKGLCRSQDLHLKLQAMGAFLAG